MKRLRPGIVAETTDLPPRQALAAAARIGSEGVQIDAVGDLSPERLTDTGRREYRNLLRSFGQTLAAVNLPLRHSLDVRENQQPRLEYAQEAMVLAFELGARKLVLPMPRLPVDQNTPAAELLRESLTVLARAGDRIGTVVALEIGFDPAPAVRDYLATYDSGSLKVTYDPANFLAHGLDPVGNLAPLTGLIAHVRARDGRAGTAARGWKETAVGAGDIDWLALTATLQVMGFDGFLTVDREEGPDRLADLAAGVKFLRRFTGIGEQQ